jgi:hypothetical protein
MDSEASFLPREIESNYEQWIAEHIWSWAHASNKAERHSTFPRDFIIKLTIILRI